MGDRFKHTKFSEGRISKKKKKYNQKFIKFDDHDVEMSGSRDNRTRRNRQEHPKDANRFRLLRKAIESTVKHQKLQPSEWYQVRILHGAKYEKENLLRLILRHVSPHVFIPVSYNAFSNDVEFYVDDIQSAKVLQSSNRKILLPDGHLMAIKVREGKPPTTPVDAGLKEKMKLVMAKRYIASNKALDLSSFVKDPDFVGGLYCPLSRPPILAAIMQIINENIPDIVALNLNSNKIQTLDGTTCSEFKKLKNLQILHLEDNNFKSVSSFNGLKDLGVTEIKLNKNPVCKNFSDRTHFVSEVRKRFPKLLKLDDVELPPVISFEVDKEETKLPLSQASFICNQEGLSVMKAFLTQYFQIYDSDNRLQLEQAYHANSFFSQSSYYPPNQSYDLPASKKLNSYIQESRNLFRVTEYPKRKSRLFMGKDNIIQYLSKLPKTQHDLSSFVVDLNFFTPALINFTVCGVFREPTSSSIETTWPIRYFCRTFLIVPINQGFCIVNDLLSITNVHDSQIANYFRKETESPTVLQSPPPALTAQSIVSPITPGVASPVMPGVSSPVMPGVVSPVMPDVSSPVMPGVASPVMLPVMDDLVRQRMVETLAAQSGMNLNWSRKCLDETQWNFERALWAFGELQKQGSIPAEAFIK